MARVGNQWMQLASNTLAGIVMACLTMWWLTAEERAAAIKHRRKNVRRIAP
jgi:hypothetical protein